MPLFQSSNGLAANNSHATPRLIDPNTGKPFNAKSDRYDEFPIPHVMTGAWIIRSGHQVYLHGKFDEALRKNREDALAMRRDAWLMSLLQERRLATASLKWHLEVDNEKDPTEKALKDGLTKVLKATPRLQSMLYYLLDAVWYGRYGSQLNYGWKWMDVPVCQSAPQVGGPTAGPAVKSATMQKRRALVIERGLGHPGHVPVNGDKIGHKLDHTPYIMVHGGQDDQLPDWPEPIYTSQAKAMPLEGWLRERFILHSHEFTDADFYEAEAAEGVHGVGIRSYIYFLDWLKKEWVSNISDFMERAGLGVRLWYYQGGNADAKARMEEIAKDNIRRINILIPRYADQRNQAQDTMEWKDVPTGGAEFLLEMVKWIDEAIERFIIGQTLSSSTEGSGLGGTGVADLHAATKNKIIAFDANNLADTLTEDFVRVVQYWTYPEYREVPVRWAFDVDQPDRKETLEAVKTFVDMGGKVPAGPVREMVGVPAPEEGDEVLSQQTMQAASAAIDGQQAAQQMAMQSEQQNAAARQQMAMKAAEQQHEERVRGGEREEERQRAAAEQARARMGHPAEHFARDCSKERKFSSTQFDLPANIAALLLDESSKVPDEELTDDGREIHPHVTVKYGLHTDDPDAVRRLIEGFGPVEIEIGDTSIFQADKYDVVKIDVHSGQLHALNKLISDSIECTDTHPEYKPHLTIAYVKPGDGEKYVGRNSLSGMRFVAEWLTFSGTDPDNRRMLPLAVDAPDQHARPSSAPDALTLHALIERLRRLGPVNRWSSAYRELDALMRRFPDLSRQLPANDVAWLRMGGMAYGRDDGTGGGTAHAPEGGVTIAGHFYKGGEFIPGEAMAKATPEQREQFGKKQDGKDDKDSKAKPATRTARVKDALAQARQLRRQVFDEIKADARATQQRIEQLSDSVRKEGMNELAWDSEAEDHSPFTELEDAIHNVSFAETTSDRNQFVMEALGALDGAEEANKMLGDTATDPDEEDWPQYQKDNAGKLAFMRQQLNAIKGEIRKYAKARKEMKAIRDGEATDYARAIGTQYAFDEKDHPRGQPDNAGQFVKGGVTDGVMKRARKGKGEKGDRSSAVAPPTPAMPPPSPESLDKLKYDWEGWATVGDGVHTTKSMYANAARFIPGLTPDKWREFLMAAWDADAIEMHVLNEVREADQAWRDASLEHNNKLYGFTYFKDPAKMREVAAKLWGEAKEREQAAPPAAPPEHFERQEAEAIAVIEPLPLPPPTPPARTASHPRQ